MKWSVIYKGSVAQRLSQLELVLLATMIFATGGAKDIHQLVLLAIAILVAIDISISNKDYSGFVHPQIVLWSAFYAAIGSLFLLIGQLNENPGVMPSFNANVIYPFFLAIMIYGLSRDHILRHAQNVIIFAGGAAALYGICAVAVTFGLLPSYMYVDIGVMPEGTGVVIHEDSIGIGINTLMPMLFIFPFMAGLLLLQYVDGVKVCNPPITILVLFLCLIFILLSGRRSVFVLAVLSPLLFFIFRAFKANRKMRRWGIIAIAVVVVGLFAVVTEEFAKNDIYFTERINSIFDYDADPSISHKKAQSEMMIAGWTESPLLGHGHGAVVEGIKSSEAEPWAYEVTYALLLHNTGILGSLAYISGILWIYWSAVKIIKRSDYWANIMIAVMMGFSGFIIANITNPYLGQLDSLWVLFYPLAIINTILLQKEM